MSERYIRAIAGSFVLLSLALGYLHSRYWHLFAAFVGLNLLQSALTRWCPMEAVLARLDVASRGGDSVPASTHSHRGERSCPSRF
jgi:hypothetical protein